MTDDELQRPEDRGEVLQPVGVAEPAAEVRPAPRRTPPRDDRRTRRQGTAHRSRIAAVGVGVAAMVGLVSNMEIAGSRAQTAVPSASTAPPQHTTDVAQHQALAREKAAAAELRRPIVLTPRTVVRKVVTPVSGGTSSIGSSSTAASSTASAPVASTSGSR